MPQIMMKIDVRGIIYLCQIKQKSGPVNLTKSYRLKDAISLLLCQVKERERLQSTKQIGYGLNLYLAGLS